MWLYGRKKNTTLKIPQYSKYLRYYILLAVSILYTQRDATCTSISRICRIRGLSRNRTEIGLAIRVHRGYLYIYRLHCTALWANTHANVFYHCIHRLEFHPHTLQTRSSFPWNRFAVQLKEQRKKGPLMFTFWRTDHEKPQYVIYLYILYLHTPRSIRPRNPSPAPHKNPFFADGPRTAPPSTKENLVPGTWSKTTMPETGPH